LDLELYPPWSVLAPRQASLKRDRFDINFMDSRLRGNDVKDKVWKI